MLLPIFDLWLLFGFARISSVFFSFFRYFLDGKFRIDLIGRKKIKFSVLLL